MKTKVRGSPGKGSLESVTAEFVRERGEMGGYTIGDMYVFFLKKLANPEYSNAGRYIL